MAERHGIGKDTVARIWRDHELRPWKTSTFKISNDLKGASSRFHERQGDISDSHYDRWHNCAVNEIDEWMVILTLAWTNSCRAHVVRMVADRFGQAAMPYSWMSPPSRSTRLSRVASLNRVGMAKGTGTSRSIPRCGLAAL
jgi:hypothetical protein